MAEPSERTAAQEINTWVQTIGIVIAAGWGVYTFIYKEVVLPKSAPVNISVNLQLKKVGPGAPQGVDQAKPLIAVEMQVTATNPSPRQVYLLPSVWIASGIVDRESDVTLSAEDTASVLNSGQAQYLQKHAVIPEAAIVAVGSLFTDTALKPNETTRRTLIIYVPAGKYDRIEVIAAMPTISKKGDITAEWKLEKEGLTPVVYRVDANNQRTELQKDPDGSYSETEYDLQMTRSTSQVSLWQ